MIDNTMTVIESTIVIIDITAFVNNLCWGWCWCKSDIFKKNIFVPIII